MCNNSFLTEWKVHYKRLLSAGESNKYSRTSADWSWNVPGLGLASFVSYLIYFIRNSRRISVYSCNCFVVRMTRTPTIVQSGFVELAYGKWAIRMTISTDPGPRTRRMVSGCSNLKDTLIFRKFRFIFFKFVTNISSSDNRLDNTFGQYRNHHYY